MDVRTIRALVAGIVIGVSLTLVAQTTVRRVGENRNALVSRLPRIVEKHVERTLKGARVLDVALVYPSFARVNYRYDSLYDAVVTYERGGKLKQITVTYGRARGAWVTPTVADLERLDDQAALVRQSPR